MRSEVTVVVLVPGDKHRAQAVTNACPEANTQTPRQSVPLAASALRMKDATWAI